MFLDDFFSITLKKVMESMEVDFHGLRSRKERRYVDARTVLVGILTRQGMSQTDVAERLGMTRQGVNRLANGLTDRMRYNTLLKDEYERIRNEITRGEQQE